LNKKAFLLMKLILLSLFLLFSSPLFARMDANMSSNPNKIVLERINMVRKARMLTKEYQMLQNRLKGWQMRKQQLIDRFEEKNRAMEDLALGHDNQYGIRRAAERRRKFYASLEEKERKIRERLTTVEMKLERLKENFRFQFAVELTEGEMFKDKVVRIKDKEKKIKMVKEYINYLESYENLRALNEKYDKVEYLLQSIAKINDNEKLFEQNLTRKAADNREKMYEYKAMADRLREEFVNRYHVEIGDLDRARLFLKNLQRAY
jgi:hypothetical protein